MYYVKLSESKGMDSRLLTAGMTRRMDNYNFLWYTLRVMIENNIKKIRKNKGLTRKAISRKSGVIYRTLENIEKGKTKNPGIVTMKKIAETLEVPIDVLLKEKGEAVNISIPSEIIEILSKKKTVYLLNLLKEANVKDLRKVLDFLISLSPGKTDKDKKAKTKYYR